MKKNGFVSSALLYGILSVFLVLVASTLSILSNHKLSNDKIKESALDDVQNLTTDTSCFTYTSNSNGNITITDYSIDCDKTVFIPTVINGELVDTIGPAAFKNKSLVNITMQLNIIEISSDAFQGNDGIIFYIKAFDTESLSGFPWGAEDATIHWK